MITNSLEIQNEMLLKAICNLAENSKKGYVIFDATNNYNIVACNNYFCILTNMEHSQIINQDYFELLFQEEQVATLEMIKQKIHSGVMVQAKLYHDRLEKSAFWAEVQALPFQNATNTTTYVLAFVENVTYYHIEDFLIRLEKEMYEAIEKDSPFYTKLKAICNGLDEFFAPNIVSTILIELEEDQLRVFTGDNCYTDISKSCAKTAFYEKVFNEENVIQVNCWDELDIPLEHKLFAQVAQSKTGWFIPIHNQQQQTIGFFSIYCTEQMDNPNLFEKVFRKIGDLVALAIVYEKTQQKIWNLAYLDTPTGLPNRYSLFEQIDSLYGQGDVKIVLPSEFHQIVELYGRSVGDDLLKQIAQRLQENEGEHNEYIARFTSSALIILTMTTDKNLTNYDRRIRHIVRQPFILAGKQVYITIKTGVAYYNEEISVKDAIRFADNAVSSAVKKPGTHVEIFTQQRNDMLEEQMMVLNYLSEALENKEISVNLQPKVHLQTGEIHSIEALARWVSPKLGFVSPAMFIPVAESAGKVRDIDNQILEKVLEWLAERQRLGKKLMKVAINISPTHFYHEGFVEDTLAMIHKYNIDPSYIIVEVTESVGLVDFQTAFAIIQKLTEQGITTSVDDFGTGFSSLSYLQRLPFSELKIDRSFLNTIDDAATLAIVRSIVQLALNLEMTSVAEGIENEEQVEILRALGCKVGQGYFYYKPMMPEQLNEILDMQEASLN
ncbi:bifunctional diguanylate cyclase/phosphodiesterase [Lysinibacillus piscis]|uniref:Bifunctional diguanylate cyclase/phosphodiesterase n=1 Tax=Lysinibacillus piscis TaxID=2518931 RepID=A0ABQ5NI22_9BACI|nr:EAL domain-containing protein [Lysinibacillus sp. KH24]GLC87929.1 bifunctional diguanylate cyclase/phosphodiesterase [Lysinibacillus sp. KH24]